MNKRETRFILMTSVAMLCPAASAAGAEAESFPRLGVFGGGAAFATDRVWRGLSQTSGDPAVIGEIKWHHSSGAFLGVWGSNVHYTEDADVHAEFDLFAGYSAKIGPVNIELAYLRYHFPSKVRNDDFGEITASAGYELGATSIRAGVFYSMDHYLGSDTVYPYLDTNVRLGSFSAVPLSVSCHIGRYEIGQPSRDGYTDWKVGISATMPQVRSFEISINYYDTDFRGPFSRVKGSEFAGSRFAIVVTKLF